MIFSSTSFLYVFLPAFLLCYLLLPWRNHVALVFSLLFFSWGEGAYLLLLLATIGVNYLIGSRLHAHSTRLLGIGVAVNLLILAYYKYFGFFVNDVLGLSVPDETLPHLPLGISFFIFQSISYLIDVYRGHASPARSYFDLALYISMFPQLIAGPIVRYGTVAQDLVHRSIALYDIQRGALLFALGLAYKTLIANNTAEVADLVFALNAEQLSSAIAWTGIVAYTLQIFFDFAGYSLMAIGLGRIMGFHFPRNFNYPYVSQSITEFWRRWHISLSSWFRDYLYIPLGGNRGGTLRTYRNLFLVFLLCGLWHGAAWTFLAWGAFHGALLTIERMGFSKLLLRSPRLLRHAYALTLIMIGWVLFRAESIDQAWVFLRAMFVFSGPEAETPGFSEIVSNENLAMAGLGLLMSLPLIERGKYFAYSDPAAAGGGFRAFDHLLAATLSLSLLFLCSIYVMSGTYNPFIYFRF